MFLILRAFLFCCQVEAVDWVHEDCEARGKNIHQQVNSIADKLSDKQIDLYVNLPLRHYGLRSASSFLTRGYKSRQLAVEYSVQLITDIKDFRLFVEVTIHL